MTDDRLEDLARRTDEYSEPPHVVDRRIGIMLWASVAQSIFLAIALIGVTVSLLRIEENRDAQCRLANESRSSITATLVASREANNKLKGPTPETETFYKDQINRFKPINCGDPAKTLREAPTTTSSIP